MNKVTLICLEGHDNSGKDTLLDMLDSTQYHIYKQDSYETVNIDKNDKTAYSNFLLKNIKKQLDEMYELGQDGKPVIIARYILSDDVFGTLYRKERLVTKTYGEEIYSKFDVYNYALLFNKFETYRNRPNAEYTEEEFNKIKELYEFFLIETSNKYTNFATYINDFTTPNDIFYYFNDFLKHYGIQL